MAILDSSFGFLGTIGNLTAYRVPGKEGIIVKRKSAVARHVLKTSPAFENSRRMSTEFGGRGMMAGWIARAARPLANVTHESITGPLNALLRPVQELDKVSAYGQRHIVLRRGRHLIEGFQLNKAVTLESVLRCHIHSTLSRDTGAAVVAIPDLVPGLNFRPHPSFPLYRVVAVLGLIPDFVYTADGYVQAVEMRSEIVPAMVSSDWRLCAESSEALRLTVANEPPADERVCLMLTLGIQYGKLAGSAVVQPVKNAGAAKIVLIG